MEITPQIEYGAEGRATLSTWEETERPKTPRRRWKLGSGKRGPHWSPDGAFERQPRPTAVSEQKREGGDGNQVGQTEQTLLSGSKNKGDFAEWSYAEENQEVNRKKGRRFFWMYEVFWDNIVMKTSNKIEQCLFQLVLHKGTNKRERNLTERVYRNHGMKYTGK